MTNCFTFLLLVFYNERILWWGNVSMAFSKSQMPKNLVKLRVEDKWFDEFLAWVIWKNPYSHFRYHSIHIVENYKTELSLYKVLVKVMFTLYKMAIKTLVHTLQRFDDFFFTKKKSSNHFKVLTWVFLATLYDKFQFTKKIVLHFRYYNSFLPCRVHRFLL